MTARDLAAALADAGMHHVELRVTPEWEPGRHQLEVRVSDGLVEKVAIVDPCADIEDVLLRAVGWFKEER